MQSTISSEYLQKISVIDAVCQPIDSIIAAYDAELTTIDTRLAANQLLINAVVVRKNARSGANCAASVFNSVILTGILADEQRLNEIATDLNSRKADLLRWKAAYNTKRGTDCVDSDGRNSAFY